MPKRKGLPNRPRAPWKHKIQEARRAAAEERQKKYDALSFEQKLEQAGNKVKAKLLAKKQ
jgi:hypothetical protein